MRTTVIAGIMGLLVGAGSLGQVGAAPRVVPRPLPSHPGNVFLAGEPVSIPAPPAGEGDTWRAVDYEGRLVAEGRVSAGPVELGPLPVGYYEVWRGADRRHQSGVHRRAGGIARADAAQLAHRH